MRAQLQKVPVVENNLAKGKRNCCNSSLETGGWLLMRRKGHGWRLSRVGSSTHKASKQKRSHGSPARPLSLRHSKGRGSGEHAVVGDSLGLRDGNCYTQPVDKHEVVTTQEAEDLGWGRAKAEQGGTKWSCSEGSTRRFTLRSRKGGAIPGEGEAEPACRQIWLGDRQARGSLCGQDGCWQEIAEGGASAASDNT